MSRRSKRDTEKPCAVCGWAEHMAVHRPVTEGPRAGQPCGHAYVPPWGHDKPPAAASLFAQAAWFLSDYAELWFHTGPHDGDQETAENDTRCAEMASLALRLRELDGEWEAKREAGTTASAAVIVADMLKDWRLPGAVWYHKGRKRWRVTGENYQSSQNEVCVGVYAPGVEAVMLLEDFEEAEK